MFVHIFGPCDCDAGFPLLSMAFGADFEECPMPSVYEKNYAIALCFINF